MPKPKDKEINEPQAKNNLFSVNVGEVSLVDGPAVPDGFIALIKSMKHLPQDGDVFQKYFVIKSVNKAKRQVYGYVLVPDKPDYQGDIMTAEEVEKAAHSLMKNLAFRTQTATGSGVNHTIFNGDVYPIVSAIDYDGSIGKSAGLPEDKINKGGWWVGLQVESEDTWNKVENGELTGFSIGGIGKRTPIEKSLGGKGVNVVFDRVQKVIGAIIKGEGDARSFLQLYNAQQLKEDLWDIFNALEDSIRSILNDGTVADKAGAVQGSIDQFKGAMGNYVAAYSATKVIESQNALGQAQKSLRETLTEIDKLHNNSPSGTEGDSDDMDEQKLKALEEKVDKLADTVAKMADAGESGEKSTQNAGGEEAQKSAQPATDEERLTRLDAKIDEIGKRLEKIEKSTGGRNGQDPEGGEEPVDKNLTPEERAKIRKRRLTKGVLTGRFS